MIHSHSHSDTSTTADAVVSNLTTTADAVDSHLTTTADAVDSHTSTTADAIGSHMYLFDASDIGLEFGRESNFYFELLKLKPRGFYFTSPLGRILSLVGCGEMIAKIKRNIIFFKYTLLLKLF